MVVGAMSVEAGNGRSRYSGESFPLAAMAAPTAFVVGARALAFRPPARAARRVGREAKLPVHQQAAAAQRRIKTGEPVEKAVHGMSSPLLEGKV